MVEIDSDLDGWRFGSVPLFFVEDEQLPLSGNQLIPDLVVEGTGSSRSRFRFRFAGFNFFRKAGSFEAWQV